MSNHRLDVTVYNGKYRFIQEANGHCKCLRYGEEWLDVTMNPGAGMALALAQEVDSLRAALAAAQAGNGQQEWKTAWLVERNGEWWSAAISQWHEGRSLNPKEWRNSWTASADKALRFARKEDAEAMIRHIGWQNALATEHVWIGAPLSASESAGALELPRGFHYPRNEE